MHKALPIPDIKEYMYQALPMPDIKESKQMFVTNDSQKKISQIENRIRLINFLITPKINIDSSSDSDSDSYSISLDDQHESSGTDDEIFDHEDEKIVYNYQRKKSLKRINDNLDEFVKTLTQDDIGDGIQMTPLRKKMEKYFNIKLTNNSVGKLQNISNYFQRKNKRIDKQTTKYVYYLKNQLNKK